MVVFCTHDVVWEKHYVNCFQEPRIWRQSQVQLMFPACIHLTEAHYDGLYQIQQLHMERCYACVRLSAFPSTSKSYFPLVSLVYGNASMAFSAGIVVKGQWLTAFLRPKLVVCFPNGLEGRRRLKGTTALVHADDALNGD